MVRVQSELALGSLADWLQAPQPLEGRGQSGESPGSQVGYAWGSTFPHLTPGLHWQEAAPRQSRHTCHELSALHLSTPPPSSLPGSPSKPCYRHRRVTSGVLGRGQAGGGTDSSPSHPFPSKRRPERESGGGADCLPEIEVGVSWLMKSTVEQVARHPQPQGEA